MKETSEGECSDNKNQKEREGERKRERERERERERRLDISEDSATVDEASGFIDLVKACFPLL